MTSTFPGAPIARPGSLAQFSLPDYLYDPTAHPDDPVTGCRLLSNPDEVAVLVEAGADHIGPPLTAEVWVPVARCLTRRAVGARRTEIRDLADSLVDAILVTGTGRCDLVADFIRPLTATVIARLVGFDTGVGDSADAESDLRVFIERLAATHEPVGHVWPGLHRILIERRADGVAEEPDHSSAADLLTALLQAQAAGPWAYLGGGHGLTPGVAAHLAGRPGPSSASARRITDADIADVLTVVAMLGGAAAATALTNAVVLADHSGVLDYLRREIDLMPAGSRPGSAPQSVSAATLEALRLEPPTPVRLVALLPTGSHPDRAEALNLARVHRDPARYPEPDTYRLDRQLRINDLMLCLSVAQHLLLTQVEVGLTTLAARLPGLWCTTPIGARPWPAAVPALATLPCQFDLDLALASS